MANHDNGLWHYSVERYQRAGVEPLLLALQDRFGADINLLLAACWLAFEGRQLSAADARRARLETASWQGNCVQPLRAVRRYLKTVPGCESLRAQVKALELDAESMEQQRLSTCLQHCAQAPVAENFRSLAERNLAAYMVEAGGMAWNGVSDLLLSLIDVIEP